MPIMALEYLQPLPAPDKSPSVAQIEELNVKPLDDASVRCRKLSRGSSSILPYDAVDTHVHIFDPRLGPYSQGRAYTPASATLDDLVSFSSKTLSRDRAPNIVLVQPSPYGIDNRVLLSILEQVRHGNSFARGIAVVDIDRIKDDELYRMHELGIRGLRLNMQASGRSFDIQDLRIAIERAAARIEHLPGWKLQLFAPASVWRDLYLTISSLPVVVIADHTGGLLGASKMPGGPATDSRSQAGFESLVLLAKEGRVLIKISGLYRSSSRISTNHDDMRPIIEELAREVPDSIIWGTDWPHTGEGKDRVKQKYGAVEAFRTVDNGGILQNIRRWVGSEEVWLKLMVDNPRRAFA